MMRKLLTLFAVLLGSIQGFAQIYAPVKWSYKATNVSPGVYDLTFKAKIDKGWHLYSQFIDEGGPVPTAFDFKDHKGFELQGKTKELSKVIKEHDPNFDMEVSYFKEEAVFVQRIKLNEKIAKVGGELTYMVCDDTKCLPPEYIDFTFDLRPNAETPENEQTVPGDDKKDGKEGSKPKDKEPADKKEGSKSPKTDGVGFFKPAGTDAPAASGILDPVSWSYEVKSTGKNEYELHLTAKIEDGWHIYGTEKHEEGPTPTSFTFSKDKNIKLIGGIEEPNKPEAAVDTTFNLKLREYVKEAVFIQKFQVLEPVKNISGKLEYMACNDMQCLPSEEVSFSVPVPEAKVETISSEPLTAIFGKGFIGGLLALVTPCVFPMIPLTVSFFTKKNKKRVKGVMSAVMYGLSIIFIYVGLGYLVSVLFGSDTLNSMASNVYFNLAFFVIFMVFAFSFFGAFEITLPSSWINKADAQSDKGGLIGIFFMAFTLALVSFSCTGPIIGNLLVIAAEGGGYSGPITGMFGFAVALAIPFTLFAIFPSWMQSLPKSGGWLNAVKVVLGFIELALALKFLSAVDLAYHWDFLKREYFLAIWIIIFTLLGFYLLGKLKFSHDSPLAYITVPRLLFAILSFSFAAYMVPGLWGAPTKLLSGLAPPLHYSEWNHESQAAILPVEGKQENKKYSDLFDCPHNLNCYFDYQEGLKKAKETGKPLMVDFTGHSCVNCRKMEDNVWVDPSVLSQIANDYILVSLYVDDKTDLAPSEVYTSKFGKEVNTLGRKWSDLQATRYNTNSQPYYVLLDHNEQTLAEPKGYTPSIESFAAYLAEGKAEFKKRMSLSAK